MARRRFPWREGMKWTAEIVDGGWWGKRPTVVTGRIKKGQTEPPATSRQASGSDGGITSYADLKLGNYGADGQDGATVGALLAAAREEFGDPDLHIGVCWDDGTRHVQRRGHTHDAGGRGTCHPGEIPKWVLVGSGPNDYEALLVALLVALLESPALGEHP